MIQPETGVLALGEGIAWGMAGEQMCKDYVNTDRIWSKVLYSLHELDIVSSKEFNIKKRIFRIPGSVSELIVTQIPKDFLGKSIILFSNVIDV